jgi:hypothetical protein
MKKLLLCIFICLIFPSSILAVAAELPAPVVDITGSQPRLTWEKLATAHKYSVEISECLECGPFGNSQETTSPYILLDIPSQLPEVWVFVRAVDKNNNVIGSYAHILVTNSSFGQGDPVPGANSNITAPAMGITPTKTATISTSTRITSVASRSQVPVADFFLPLITISVVIITILLGIFLFSQRRSSE